MTVPGRVVVSSRALRSAARAAAAEAFGSDGRAVSVEVVERGPAIDVAVSTPMRPVDGILTVAAERRDAMRERLGTVTGAEVGRVDVRVRGLVRTPERRVR